MLQDVKNKPVHWPAVLLFTLALLSAYSVILEGLLINVLQVSGFACLGFASLRMVPADLFSQKLSRVVRVENAVPPPLLSVALLIAGAAALITNLMLR